MNARIKKKQQKIKAKTTSIRSVEDIQFKLWTSVRREAYTTPSQQKRYSANMSKIIDKYVKVNDTKISFDGDKTGADMWAAIKKYYDNVNSGKIKEIGGFSVLSSDEQANYAIQLMSQDDYEDYIKMANEKAEKLLQDDLARRANIGKRYNFAF